MLSNQVPLPEILIEKTKVQIREMITLGSRSKKVNTEVVEKPKISVQDRMKEQVIEYSGDINIILDTSLDEILAKKKPQLDVVKWLKDNEVKSIQSGMISLEFTSLLEEFCF